MAADGISIEGNLTQSGKACVCQVGLGHPVPPKNAIRMLGPMAEALSPRVLRARTGEEEGAFPDFFEGRARNGRAESEGAVRAWWGRLVRLPAKRPRDSTGGGVRPAPARR